MKLKVTAVQTKQTIRETKTRFQKKICHIKYVSSDTTFEYYEDISKE
jgi:hypothetical protein